jgi:hypothetical protein
MHYIQSYILDKLASSRMLRNKDMRPPQVESNLYQYHLLQLQKLKFIKKIDGGYTLSKNGLAYADMFSNQLKKQRPQPKIVNVLFVTNDKRQLLLRHKQRQPFIETYGLVVGKIHQNEDIRTAALREFKEKVSSEDKPSELSYFGTAHITIKQNGCTISEYIGLMQSVKVDRVVVDNENSAFYSFGAIKTMNLMPSVIELIGAYKNHEIFLEKTIEI